MEYNIGGIVGNLALERDCNMTKTARYFWLDRASKVTSTGWT